MRCEEVQQQLREFSTGKLPMDVRQTVQAHLSECAACRAALARVDLLAGALSSAQTPPIPPGFASRVMARARQRQANELVAVWSPLRWWTRTSTPMHVAVAAMLVIGLIIGFVMGWTATPLTSQTTTATQSDPLKAYQVDYLGEAPEGSLADRYLSLVLTTNEGGR
jgi:anti-sigma factor RsiW